MKTSLQDPLRKGSVRRVRPNKRVTDNALAKAHKDLVVAAKLIELNTP